MNDLDTVHFFARSPEEMVTAQNDLIDWAQHRIEDCYADLADAENNLHTARQHKWKVSGWQGRVSYIKRRLRFYEKVKIALRAGYWIVPPFPIDVFAVRTNTGVPRARPSSLSRYPQWPIEPTRDLPPGEGSYVKPDPLCNRIADAEDSDKHRLLPVGLQDADFPFKWVKPQVLSKTAEAMASKIFDEIGMVGAQTGRGCGDPMVIGRIKRPGQYQEPLSFFIAWWFPAKDL